MFLVLEKKPTFDKQYNEVQPTHINFNNNRSFIVDQNSKKMVTMGVEQHNLFWLLDVEITRLVQQKDGSN